MRWAAGVVAELGPDGKTFVIRGEGGETDEMVLPDHKVDILPGTELCFAYSDACDYS